MTIKNIRQAFEKWADEKGDWPLDKYVSGNYEDENCHAAWDGFRAGVKECIPVIELLKDLHEWTLWPDLSPELDSQCEIWTPEGGNQFTKFGTGDKNKPPYFYWCGSPSKVWWRYVRPPVLAYEESEQP